MNNFSTNQIAQSKGMQFWLSIKTSRTGLAGGIIIATIALIAILAPLLSPYGPADINMDNRLQPPSLNHLMGTDFAGRDILTRIIWGARPSLQIGFFAVLIGLPGGIGIGLLA